jgi:glycosyltransferase involved in cell wall biosynthesis
MASEFLTPTTDSAITKMDTPLVSVLMTAFNREKFIGQAIESVLASSYRNFELIIVDDGSSDATVPIAESYAAADSRVKVFINEKNLGDYSNRNRAASHAGGKYIKYLDADDMIYPWGLAIVVGCMEQYPEAAYGLDSLAQDNGRIFPFLLGPEDAYFRAYFEAPLFDKAPTSCIIRRTVFESEGGFVNKRLVGDFEFWHRLSLKHKVLLMPHGIIWSRIHDEQESKATRDSSLVLFQYSVVSREYLSHDGCPLKEKDKRIALKRVIRSQARSALRSLLIEKNIPAFRQKLSQADFSVTSCLVNAIRNAK